MIKKMTTKELLATSLIELAEKFSIQNISIAMICQNCTLSSRTFYNHFKDKDELIFWIYCSMEDAIIDKINGDYDWSNALIDTLRYFKKNKKFFRNVFINTNGYNSFTSSGTRHTYENARKVIKKRTNLWPLSESIEFKLKLYFYGANAMTYDWVVDGMKDSPEVLGEKLIASMPDEIKELMLN